MGREEKKIYLTFDDGPVPGVTPAALSVLKEHDVKATFFCVGDNVRKHPGIFQQIIAEGHAVGNHTYHHVDGWNTPARAYLREVQQCAEVVPSKIFRPPYGRMRPPQRKAIQRKFTVVLWDVLTCDFNKELSGEDCLELALNYSRPGSIVVFHDSEQAKERMLSALPRFLDEMQGRGYAFGVIK